MPRKSTARASRRVGRIEDDTPIMPHIVADAVIAEVDRCVPMDLSASEERAIADRLADRADQVYARNESFRRKIRAAGNRGRDALYAYMRHWLASDLKTLRPGVFAQLPQRFLVGEELDCAELRPVLPHLHATKKTKRQLDREIAEALAKSQRWHVMFQVPGSPWVWLSARGGGTMNPDDAHDFGSQEAARARADAMTGPRSSLAAKVVSRKKP